MGVECVDSQVTVSEQSCSDYMRAGHVQGWKSMLDFFFAGDFFTPVFLVTGWTAFSIFRE